MPRVVTSTATCVCTMGVAPGTLNALPIPTIPTAGKLTMLTISDVSPGVNITPFGACRISTPLPPIPCVPAPAGTWAPPAVVVKVGGKPALLDSAKLQCSLGGTISIVNSGQQTVQGK